MYSFSVPLNFQDNFILKPTFVPLKKNMYFPSILWKGNKKYSILNEDLINEMKKSTHIGKMYFSRSFLLVFYKSHAVISTRNRVKATRVICTGAPCQVLLSLCLSTFPSSWTMNSVSHISFPCSNLIPSTNPANCCQSWVFRSKSHHASEFWLWWTLWST